MMDGSQQTQNSSDKPKKKRSQGNQPKKEGKNKGQGGVSNSGNMMPNTVQYHPDVKRLGPEGQGTSPARVHNLPPKKSLSPSFIATHAALLEGSLQQSEHSRGQQYMEQSHTVQHLPTPQNKQPASMSQVQGSGERFLEQMIAKGQQMGSQPRQFAPVIDQGGLLRQQLLHGIRQEPQRSSPSYNRQGTDQPRSYPSPPPNRTVHNIPGASPPGDRGRPRVETMSEAERTSPYHVSTIRKTPSPAPKHSISPAQQLSPHYRHEMVSPGSVTGDRHGSKSERTQLSLEEALKLMQGHPGVNIPQQILTQLAQQAVRTEPEEVIKNWYMDSSQMMKEPPHKERSTKQFISTMLANQAKSRHPGPSNINPQHALTVDTQGEHVGMPPLMLSTQLIKVSPRQVSPSGGERRQVSPSGARLMTTSGGVTTTQIYHTGLVSIPTSAPQTTPTSTALLQPQATLGSEAIKRIPSPKPQHRHKDFAQAQNKATTQNIHIPENAGPIRQPVVELVKIPLKTTDSRQSSFSASQMANMPQYMNLSQMSHPSLANPPLNQLPFSQLTQAQGVSMATEITKASQGIMNPFTFPPKPPAMIPQPKSQPRYEVISPVVPLHDEYKRKLSDIEMPQLELVPPLQKESSPVKVEMVKMKSPFNMRLQNLANLPTNSMYRSTYRSHSMAVQRAKIGLVTSTAKTLDLLRQNLQKFINKEIDVIVKQYLDKFFRPGIENIKFNNGENSVTDEHVQAVCRQILEEAKKMYTTEQRSATPVRDENTPVPFMNRKRNASDTDSEKSSSFIPRKKKGRPPIYISGRSTPSKPTKANEPVKREGPKWDSSRLVSTTKYIMGARANKALGLGATRGRIYIKHPDVFKYCGDQDDKQWLYENHRMPATGGKAYMMLLEDVKDLAEDDEYRNNANVMLDEIIGFCIPDWMTEKVKGQMDALRTDKAKQRSRSTTPNDGQPGTQQGGTDVYKDLPFSNFSSSKGSPRLEKDELQTSPSGDTEMEFLTGGDNEDQNMNNLSPFNLTGGFDDGVSPSASDLDTLEDDAPLSAPFAFSK